MVKKFMIFAVLASMAAAAPTFGPPKSGGGFDFGFGGSKGGAVSMGASVGFNGKVAGGLEACWSGATSGCVDDGYKQELGAWIKGAGKGYFDNLTCDEISKWCSGSANVDFKVMTPTQSAMGAAFGADASCSAAGGPFAFFNGEVEKGYEGADCACKAMDEGHQQSLQVYLEGINDADVQKSTRGSLQVCAAGGIAATLKPDALASLKGWLSAEECTIEGDLLDAVKRWCTIGKGSGHKSSSGGANVVLSESNQVELAKFCGSSEFAVLDLKTQAGLKACASGGVAGSLDTPIQGAIDEFIKTSSCPLGSGLKGSIDLWLSGQTGKGCESGSSPDAYGYVGAGAEISGNFGTSGSLTVEAQDSLSGFCSNAGASLDTGILESLNVCAKGGLSSSLDVPASADLSAWLGSSDCSLDSNLRGSVMTWLSVGISGSGGPGVGTGGGSGFAFSGSALGSISEGIGASGQLSSTVKGALGVCTAGGVAGSVSFNARAELGAFLCSDAGVSVGVDVQSQLMGWLCGSDNKGNGSSKGYGKANGGSKGYGSNKGDDEECDCNYS